MADGQTQEHVQQPRKNRVFSAQELRKLALSLGADDAGCISIDREEVAGERPYILSAFPAARALLSIACRLNPDNVRSPARSIGNLEFHHNYDHVNDVARAIVRALADRGVRALNPAAGFPMEMDDFPGRIWVVSHKPVAVAAGLGDIGIHRSVIHPRFGSFINLATIIIAAEVTEESVRVDTNPCLSCKLCVAACPVGAIAPDGYFNFSACYTHNYREFMGGFTDWAGAIAESRSRAELQSNVSDQEQASMWQSLSFGANYKAAYCIAVCPAGSDVISPWLEDKVSFVKEIVEPLQSKREPLYVLPGSDARQYAERRFPHKTIRVVTNNLKPRTIEGFLAGLPLSFQRNKSKGLNAVFHFNFTGRTPAKATIAIRDRQLRITEGLTDKPDMVITADADAWLSFAYKERGLMSMLLGRKLRLRGNPRLMQAFGACFPG